MVDPFIYRGFTLYLIRIYAALLQDHDGKGSVGANPELAPVSSQLLGLSV